MRIARKAVIKGYLSVYCFGHHIVDGRRVATILHDNGRLGHASMTPSLAPIHMALNNLGVNFSTGDVVKVTVEIQPKRKRALKR